MTDWEELLFQAECIGIRPAEFWSSTPAELLRRYRAVVWQEERQARQSAAEGLSRAWFTERFRREKQLRSLQHYLNAMNSDAKEVDKERRKLEHEMIVRELGEKR